ncbi:MAG: hypothetical protein F8N37_19720 [Telmatospirillum sp.]|nr:hypothetical protein [Telmatospirillum sp.]
MAAFACALPACPGLTTALPPMAVHAETLVRRWVLDPETRTLACVWTPEDTGEPAKPNRHLTVVRN